MQDETNKCVCEEYAMEPGDTLYFEHWNCPKRLFMSADLDGGIGFDPIRNIQYCPVCGRKLEEYHAGREH